MILKSTAAKAGSAGALATAGGGAATYLAWDRITLYEVEREVLEKDLKLTVEVLTNAVDGSNKTVTIKAEPKSGHSWSCVITVAQADAEGLSGKIKDNLPINDSRVAYWDKSKQYETRNLLVRACSKNRKTKESSTVVGTLTLADKGSQDSFSFKDYPELNYLLKSDLNKVEREVIEKDVKLKVENASNTPKITVESTQPEPALTSGTSWSCEITLDPADTDQPATIVSSLQSHLYHSSIASGTSINDSQRNNKELLVRACSKVKADGDSDTAVKRKLTLEKSSSKYDSFKDHPELNHLLTPLSKN